MIAFASGPKVGSRSWSEAVCPGLSLANLPFWTESSERRGERAAKRLVRELEEDADRRAVLRPAGAVRLLARAREGVLAVELLLEAVGRLRACVAPEHRDAIVLVHRLPALAFDLA